MLLNNYKLKSLYGSQINREVNRYNKRAHKEHQGSINATWIKYVLQISSKQWHDICNGSKNISLSKYQQVLKRIHISEKRVFGSTLQSNNSHNNKQVTFNKSKQNLQRLLHRTQAPRRSHKITKIEVQKNHKHRFNVFINHKYAFPVSEDVLIKYTIHQGQNISPRLKSDIEESDKASKLYDYAIGILDHHPKTVYEMTQRLKHRSTNNKYVHQAIHKLIVIDLLNDQRYANEFVIDQLTLSNKGKEVIKHKLQLKHVPLIYINKAISKNYKESIALSHGVKQAQLKFKMLNHDSFYRKLNKIKRFLLRRGYTFSEINKILDEAQLHPNKKKQQKILYKKTHQALKRYNKYSKYKKVIKVKSYLSRQGFSFDEISQALNKIL